MGYYKIYYQDSMEWNRESRIEPFNCVQLVYHRYTNSSGKMVKAQAQFHTHMQKKNHNPVLSHINLLKS